MRMFLLVAALFGADPVTEYQDKLQLAQQRGERLYAYDRVAWVGTDEALPEIEDRMAEGRGYVIHDDRGDHVLTFFGEEDGAPYALWRATYRGEQRLSGGRVEKDDPAAPFSVAELAVYEARKSAIEAFFAVGQEKNLFFCEDTQNPNVAVLPPTGADAAFQVYFMTPQPDMRTYPVGGHSRVSISADGEIGEIRRFTNSCISLQSNDGTGSETVAMFVTHSMDPIPTELHVFTALASKKDVMVLTDDRRVWLVDGEQITLSDIEIPNP